MADLDALDTAILRELQDDARRTNRDVAAAVGVAPTTALDRTRALRDRGVILGASLDVDLAAIGRPVQALVAVRIRPPTRRNIEGFRSWAIGLPETLGVFVTTGTEDFPGARGGAGQRQPLRVRDRPDDRAARGRRRPHVRRLRAPAPAAGRAGQPSDPADPEGTAGRTG
jgi:hypothetical protein